MLNPQSPEPCLQPCCLDTTYQYQYDIQYDFEDYQLQHQYPYFYQDPSPSPDPSFTQSFAIMSVDGNFQEISGASPSPSPPEIQQQMQHQQQQQQQPPPDQEKGLMEALEIARETDDGMRDPTIRNLLETAITRIWNKVLEQPDTYILAKDEFAIFNFFQHRFLGNEIAIAARKRFWSTYRG